MQKTTFSEQGFSKSIVIAAIVVVAVAGIGGWLVYKNNSKPPANANTAAVRKALKNAKCDSGDANICKFFTSWNASRYYTANTTTTVGSTTNTSVLKVDGDNHHLKINSELLSETITLGTALYTKDTEKNKWYKQTLTKPSTTGFEYDASDLSANSGKRTYKQLGKEACGELTCLKYQIINAADQDLKHYIWFDDYDYQLRKQTVEQNTSKATTTFTYDRVTITEPSPYTELRDGEVYIPGQGVFNPSATPGINTSQP